MDIIIFTSGGVQWEGGKCFLYSVTIIFHECNNTNITYQPFYSYLRWYFSHGWYCCVTMFFSFPLKNCTLATKNASSPTVLDLGGWMRFRSRSSKKTLHKRKNVKNQIFFKNLILKELGMWSPAPSVWKWNKIINFVVSVKLLAKMHFLQDP